LAEVGEVESMRQFEAAKLACLTYLDLTGKEPILGTQAAIQAKLAQLLRGIPAEYEFLMLARWSDKCRLVHRLDSDVHEIDGKYVVPDFLCLCEVEGKQIPVLVEVKSSVKENKTLSKKYCSKLLAYGSLLGLPVLIAYRFKGAGRPFWALIDLSSSLSSYGTCQLKMPAILMSDLFEVFFGFYSVQVAEGTSVVVEILKHGQIDETHIEGTIKDIYWNAPDGRRIELKTVPYLTWLFTLNEDDVDVEEEGNFIKQRFTKITETAVLIYWLLPFFADSRSVFRGKEPNWRKAVLNGKPSIKLSDLDQTIQEGLSGGLIQSVIRRAPREFPRFLSHIKQTKSLIRVGRLGLPLKDNN
jgi:hypothetical protein